MIVLTSITSRIKHSATVENTCCKMSEGNLKKVCISLTSTELMVYEYMEKFLVVRVSKARNGWRYCSLFLSSTTMQLQEFIAAKTIEASVYCPLSSFMWGED